ncbi:MAG: endonuclease domain-containing protein [Terriglobales bacterium]
MPTRSEPRLCECCGRLPGKRSLALDHDHVTGAFRGWLCGKCNAGIGLLGDTLDGILAAVQYIQFANN